MMNRHRFLHLSILPLLAAMVVLFAVADTSARQADKKKKMTFEVYEDKGGEFRWRLKAADGKIVAVPEDAYKNHGDVKSAISSIQKNISKMKTEYYEDKSKMYRWRIKATNGRVMARSTEGYKSKDEAGKVADLFRNNVASASVEEKK